MDFINKPQFLCKSQVSEVVKHIANLYALRKKVYVRVVIWMHLRNCIVRIKCIVWSGRQSPSEIKVINSSGSLNVGKTDIKYFPKSSQVLSGDAYFMLNLNLAGLRDNMLYRQIFAGVHW